MDFLQQLTTVDDIKSTLESIQQEENGLSRRILFNLTGSQDFYDIPDDDTAVKSSVIEYNRIVSDLQSIGSSVENVTGEINSICSELTSCSSEAVKASADIKHYNTLMVNAGKSLDLVTAMIDLNKSVSGIERSLENEEYEKATDYILRYRKAILTGDISAKDATIMEKSTATLIKALSDQLDLNILKKKTTQVFRYCHLLDSLGEARSILDKLVGYLLSDLVDQDAKDYSLLQNQRSSQNIGVVVGNMLSGCYKKGVELIDQCEEQFESTFRIERLAYCYFIRRVFLHCDDHCARLLTYYATIRDIATIAENAKQVLQQYVTAESGVENRELDQLNQVLNELSLLLQYNESFSRYFNGKAGDALAFVAQLPPLDRSYLDKYPSTSVLPVELVKTLAAIEQKKCIPQGSQLQSAKILQQFCQCYTSMEESYALYSLNRSIFNVTCDPDTHCTSLPEESFYLFEIILSRAVSQGNVRNICTVISVIKGSIDQYLHSFFLAVIRGRRLLNTPSLQTSLSREQLSVVFTMNDVTTSIDFLNKFANRALRALMDVFPQVPGVVRKSLDDLSNAALLLFNGCVELVMRRFKEMLGPLAQKVEKRILAGNFAATNDVQVEQAAEEILGAAMNMIHNSVDPYVECLLPETVTTMMNELAALLAARLESSIGRMKYSQQGILALDKIVRGISNELIAAGGSEIRTNFAKVNTMIAVLSCDDVTSAYSLVINDKNEMSKDQVKALLALRVDLKG
ncbi:hypothetical protein WA588_004742 [Blastocystis sp. NMH]